MYKTFTAMDAPLVEDYDGLDEGMRYLVSTFRNSIGDINMPLINNKSFGNVAVIWLIWTFNIYNMLIISLNFLIAVIS